MYNKASGVHSDNIWYIWNIQRRPQDESLRKRQTMLVRVPSVEKYRRMTCLTHIHSGICPYGRRRVFLHDPRVSSARPGLRAFPASKGTSKSANVKDTFYWPDQRNEDISANLEFSFSHFPVIAHVEAEFRESRRSGFMLLKDYDCVTITFNTLNPRS